MFRAPGGTGPYGIATTPKGPSGTRRSPAATSPASTPHGQGDDAAPADARPGARRVWSDSHGRLWVSEWNAGKVARYDPATRKWREWRLPGAAQPYAVYVDEKRHRLADRLRRGALVRFDPATQRFTRIRLRAKADVRQLLGRPGEVWGAESGADRIVSVVR